MLCILFKVQVPKQCCALENMMNLIASYFNHYELLMLQVRESGEIARSNYSPNLLEIMRTSIDLFTYNNNPGTHGQLPVEIPGGMCSLLPHT